VDAIWALRRDPARYLGFVEVHIEQGPVLDAAMQPLGIVTSINGSHRYLGHLTGRASHAGTTPMDQRHDALLGLAELALFVEAEAKRLGCVGTVGICSVPNGSINVVPGRVDFSLDLRAPTDATRDALRDAVLAELDAVCERRHLQRALVPTVAASAAPSHPAWQARWEAAVQRLGLPLHQLPSGAGHDAMQMHKCMPQAMLFLRGGNEGISHNPLESITAHDAQLAVDAFAHLWEAL
jgi:N-carbamoyl-L-amino-acid hydrolase